MASNVSGGNGGMDESSGGGNIDIDSLDLSKLNMVKDAVQSDLNRLGEERLGLQKGIDGFRSSLESVVELSKCNEGQPLLVPMAESVYVHGKCGRVDRVMVDVGGGYHVEKTTSQVHTFCEERIKILTDRMAEVAKAIEEKTRFAQIVQQKLRAAVYTLQQQQQQQGTAVSAK
eukprot:GHVQ01003054.1.p1 GENE.GHVQ01003054.1~~GHVQ01003054.1.p1  ORF type:complete len:173 (-),score=47.56 GHVQ01003054.1:508-1026(-)